MMKICWRTKKMIGIITIKTFYGLLKMFLKRKSTQKHIKDHNDKQKSDALKKKKPYFQEIETKLQKMLKRNISYTKVVSTHQNVLFRK